MKEPAVDDQGAGGKKAERFGPAAMRDDFRSMAVRPQAEPYAAGQGDWR